MISMTMRSMSTICGRSMDVRSYEKPFKKKVTVAADDEGSTVTTTTTEPTSTTVPHITTTIIRPTSTLLHIRTMAAATIMGIPHTAEVTVAVSLVLAAVCSA
ncbi:hypothetical protein TELCIR_23744 [Teladorsagia circumcincta]|uniref:Uncharacterized protein n=1 Tax=Teladorsagia circumcincta TaxID=45464 RepID=A0A2G9TA83_TELCI|nr:hypothetical protein TELCIR_23744 [Teladorsagia circumcincta]